MLRTYEPENLFLHKQQRPRLAACPHLLISVTFAVCLDSIIPLLSLCLKFEGFNLSRVMRKPAF